jgi:SEC-C motif domain protein
MTDMLCSLCPCGSTKIYSDCCGAFIEGAACATTPEQLMRSRFTAYATGRIDYIEKTMYGKALKLFNRADANHSLTQIKWLDLKIINAPASIGDEGIVEFTARYLMNNEIHTLHERSLFRLYKKRWLYTDQLDVSEKII